MSINDTIYDWYDNWYMDPRVDPDLVVSGDRDQTKPMTARCQYWVKGMPGLCNHWDTGECKCTFSWTESEDKPLNFNDGNCDGLGRAADCTKYESNVNIEEDYICILPKLDLSGVGKQDTTAAWSKLSGVPIEEIGGYNAEEGTCVGRCDGLGMGRGEDGLGLTTENLYELPVVCRYYRPWQMGFGAIEPRGIPDQAKTKIGGRWVPDPTAKTKDIYDGSEDDPRSTMFKRLPFGFKIYNARALFQKCAHWDSDLGSNFILDDTGDAGYELILLEEDLCTCTDSSATPYHTIDESIDPNLSWIISEVWSEAGTVVCNGAKPECPCYTGKWVYCTDEFMRAGMRITVDQIMELRFWTAKWSNKDEYIEFYEKKPGPTDAAGISDPTTHLLYTFAHWDQLDPSDPNASVMKGHEYDLCVPAPLHKRYFDPDVYVKKEGYEYPPLKQTTPGLMTTTGPRFPTLVRDFETEYIIPLDIYYPYSQKDPWGDIECDQPSEEFVGIKKNYSMDGDSIIIVGATVREKTVYAININNVKEYFLNVDNYLTNYKSVYSMSAIDQTKFSERISDIIDTLEKERSEEVYSNQSNSEGFFTLGPVNLNYTEYNDLLILVRYPSDNVVYDIPDSWEFRLKKVWCQFHGGLVAQTSFTHEHGGGTYDIGQPEFFPSKATATAKCTPINSPNAHGCYGHVGWVKNGFSYKFVNPLAEYDYYAYVIAEKTLEGQITEKWIQVGSTGKVWAEIEDDELDYKLNYVLPWEIIEAKMLRIYGDDEEPAETEVEMEVVYPNTGVEQNTMPPNAFMLEPKDGRIRGFFNNDWVLTITYKYTFMDDSMPDEDDSNINITFPNFYESFGDGVYFVDDPPAELSWYGGDTYSMSTGIRRGTMAAVTGFFDEDNRLYSAIATKLCAYVTTQGCRSVEIYYAYLSNASGYDLMPNSGFFTFTAANKALSGDYKHGIVAPCGTHDCNPSNCIGPMWYPFNSCADHMFYNVYTGPNQCTQTFRGQPEDGITQDGTWVYRSDYRYVNPELYKAWARIGGNWAAACGNGWYYSYSKASSTVKFTGYCNIRGKVDLAEFALNGWQRPPFGNSGREIVERWMSKDYSSYIDLSQQPPATEAMWMPHIFDDTDLYFSFNCFDERSGGYPTAPDYFSHISQLSLLISNEIGETVNEESRYKFKDIIELTHHGACMYPPPYSIRPSGAVGVTRYRFKDNNIAWAWRNFWDPIERNINEVYRFLFLDLSYPEYYYNPYKDEIQYVCDENDYKLYFTAPVIEESEFVTYPSISLGNGPPRYFEVIYDNYDHTLVDWKDEDEEGAVDGSSGGNIYEKTSGSDWNHDENIIFQEGAVETIEDAINEDRQVQTGYDDNVGEAIYKYYNKGLIAHIYKDRLISLPMEESLVEVEPEITSDLAVNIYNLPGDLLVTTLDESTSNPVLEYTFEENPVCITKIVINGHWGIFEKSDVDGNKIDIEACKPGILVTAVLDDSTITLYESKYLVGDFLATTGSSESSEKYTIKAYLPPTPNRMIAETTSNLSLKLKIVNGEWICIDSIEVYYSEYIDGAIEEITTWEQSYTVSEGSGFGDLNLDGTESRTYRSYQRDYQNSGQFFPSTTHEDEFYAIDKMTSVACNEMGEEKESVDISYGNLMEKEVSVQKEVYEKMINLDSLDQLQFNLQTPPKISAFLNSIGIQSRIIGDNTTFTSTKLVWDKNSTSAGYVQGTFWRPGGHWYQWGAEAFRARCYLFGEVEEVYSPVFIHHDHGGVDNPTDPGHAYAGWVRKEYYDGRLQQFEGEPNIGEQPVDPLTGAQQNIY